MEKKIQPINQSVAVLPNIDVSHLNDFFLDSNGNLKPVDSYDLHQIHEVDRMVWANRNSVYHFITTQMIQWLSEVIDGRSAIEICSGNGGIGRALNIPATDSYMQTLPEVIGFYLASGQRPIFPPKDVIKMEASQAVSHYKPKVAIGAFVTQKFLLHDISDNPGSMYGVDEEDIVSRVETYVMLGNAWTHRNKRVFRARHTEYKNLPWQVTRAIDQKLNRVWVWDKRDLKKKSGPGK